VIDPTHFANVDLDVISREDLRPLAAALEHGAYALNVEKYRRRWRATFEVHHPAKQDSADAVIVEFGRVLKRLRGEGRRLFVEAEERVFDIGINGGLEPHSFHQALSLPALKIALALRTTIAITVYRPYDDEVQTPP
jgi:hypothetical protein